MNKNKPITEKRFYFTFHENLYWSKAYQDLTPSAKNLMMCFYTEIRWTGSGEKRIITNNGDISFSEAEFKANKLGASQTYINARNQLIKVGFIKITYRGGMARGDIKMVADEIGHASVVMTEKYAKCKLPKLQDDFQSLKERIALRLVKPSEDTYFTNLLQSI